MDQVLDGFDGCFHFEVRRVLQINPGIISGFLRATCGSKFQDSCGERKFGFLQYADTKVLPRAFCSVLLQANEELQLQSCVSIFLFLSASFATQTCHTYVETGSSIVRVPVVQEEIFDQQDHLFFFLPVFQVTKSGKNSTKTS